MKMNRNEIKMQMALMPCKTPFKKIRLALLHKAMRGDAKAQRQLKALQNQIKAICA